MPFSRFLFCTFFVLLLASTNAVSKVQWSKYGNDIVVSTVGQNALVYRQVDSMLSSGNMLLSDSTPTTIEIPHVFIDKTVDFYLLVLLCLLLGLVRYTDPRYFDNLFRVFANPGQSSSAKEQIGSSAISNVLMNLFFVIVAGAYMFYAINSNAVQPRTGGYRSYFILMLIGGITLVYAAKYMVLQFTGWVFKIKHITEYYIFNVFLMNKIMAVLLLPIIIILAFANAGVYKPAFVVSIAIIIVLFCFRYIRSWRSFGSFFQYSKFHFFTYLCASEILPLAVLMKLLVDGLHL